jgi:hypothetical protein
LGVISSFTPATKSPYGSQKIFFGKLRVLLACRSELKEIIGFPTEPAECIRKTVPQEREIRARAEIILKMDLKLGSLNLPARA